MPCNLKAFRIKFLLACLWVYTLTLLLYLGNPVNVDRMVWPFRLLDWALPFTLAISVFFGLLSIRLKRWILAGLSGVIILASLWNMRGLWVDGIQNLPANGRTYTIMTHNAGNGLADPQPLVDVLRNSGADLIGLQEITADQANAIDKSLAGLYPYRIMFGDGIPGKGLLSKFPITNFKQLNLYPDRPDLLATIQLADAELTVIVAHPPPPRLHTDGIYMNAATQQQLYELIRMATHGGPVLMMGDFNMTTRSIFYTTLRRMGLIDAFEVAGQGPGFTLPLRWKNIPLLPMARVDYIWHTSHLVPLKSWIGENTGSDHLPVLAQLQWNWGAAQLVH
jgi:vancomycin resistance protein VanJ